MKIHLGFTTVIAHIWKSLQKECKIIENQKKSSNLVLNLYLCLYGEGLYFLDFSVDGAATRN